MSKETSYIVVPPHNEVDMKVGNFSEQLLLQYLKYQRDPVIGTQTGRVKFLESGTQWVMESSLPINIPIDKEPVGDPIDWEVIDEVESQGNALWKYSLGYLPTYFEVSLDYSTTARILDSLWEYTKSDQWEQRASWMTSLDHALATRIRSLTTLVFLFQTEFHSVPEALTNIVRSDVVNLVRGRESFFPANNHGAMAAVALLHAAAVFPQIRREVQEMGLNDPLEVGLEELHKVLDSIFNDAGLAAENSPEYQRFWVTLLEPVSKFLKLFEDLSPSFTKARAELDSLLENAREVFLQFLDGAGRMIPIGDTHPRYVSSFKDPVEFRGAYEDLGFAVYKSEGTTLTFNCGSTNYAHKHCDDTSITLDYEGDNLILDSGYYSHDWNDPKAIFTKSQNAHSGLFACSLDNLHPGKVHFPGRERVKATMQSLSEDSWDMVGRVLIDGALKLERRVIAKSSRAFDIIDSIQGEPRDFGGVVSRYIFRAGRKMSLTDNRLWMDFERCAVEFTFLGQLRDEIRFVSALEGSELKGWISPELNQLEPAVCLEVPLEDITSLTTQIRIV